jgi:hypothetical protein
VKGAFVTATLAVALAGVIAGCGGSGSSSSAGASATAGQASSCPAAWRPDWQKLANDVGTTVYCPGWMSYPLDGDMDGAYDNGRWVDADKSYLVSFLWVDHDGGVSREVHVNLRGYPGRTTVPTCEETITAGGKTSRKPIPCFSDERETRKVGGVTATVYTVNQGIDAWHVLYAWRQNGALYTISEHVVAPYTYKDVVRNLDRMARRLVPLEPTV